MGLVSHYLEYALKMESRKNIIKKAIIDLETVADCFDFIAVTGTSGLLMGPSIADALNKPTVVIRKARETSHSMFEVEGDIPGPNYIIVDDFVSTGRTIANIISQIEKQREEETNCVGVRCYKPLYKDEGNCYHILAEYFSPVKQKNVHIPCLTGRYSSFDLMYKSNFELKHYIDFNLRAAIQNKKDNQT